MPSEVENLIDPFEDKVEIEDDTSSQEEEPVRYNVSSYGWDSDAEGLVKRLNRDDIIIPNFQRKYIWNNKSASRFIESLILGLPVPSVFLSVDPVTKKFNIIDGQQRLLSLKRYYAGEFALNAPDIQPALRGKNYPIAKETKRPLQDSDKRNLDNSLIHSVVIKQEVSPEDDNEEDYDQAIYQVFHRLNTTGSPLQDQEIRASLYHGSFNDLLNELNEDKNWRKLFGAEKHSRLKDIEAILRFFALLEDFSENESKYKPSMKRFLSSFMKKYREVDEQKAESLRKIFIAATKKIADALGETAFKTGTTFMLSTFDATMVALSRALINKVEFSEDQVRSKFAQLKDDKDFQYGTEKFVNDADRVKARMKAALAVFGS